MTVKDNTSGIVLVQGTAAAVTPAEAGRIMGKALRRFGAPQQLHVDFGREFASEKFMRVVNSAEVMLYVGSSPRPCFQGVTEIIGLDRQGTYPLTGCHTDRVSNLLRAYGLRQAI
jgi:hypothetical protein